MPSFFNDKYCNIINFKVWQSNPLKMHSDMLVDYIYLKLNYLNLTDLIAFIVNCKIEFY